MKTILIHIKTSLVFTLFSLFLTSSLLAQSPDKMSYQAVVRDANDNLLANSTIGMQISILQDSETGSSVYVETHSALSNANGLVSLEIGTGTVVSGDFSTIDWSGGSYFIKTESDPNGGSDYTISGTSQLLSVPYALYATSSGESLPYTAGDGIDISGNEIQNTAPDQDVFITGSGATSVSGSYPSFTISSTDEVNDEDADPDNEIQDLTISGDQLSISDGNSVTLPTGTTYTAGTDISITANSINNTAPDQTVSLSGSGATSISGSYPDFTISSTDLVNDADADPDNEIQDISLVGTDLSISDGSTVDLSSLASNDGWNISGNSGTVAGTNFIGTTDDINIDFRTNNVIRTRITTNSQIEILNSGQSVFIGEGAGQNDDLSTNKNTFIGYQSGMANTTGDNCVAFGYQSFLSNTTGSNNTAIGRTALRSSTTGNSNTAVGINSMYSNIGGSNNSAFGALALNANTEGVFNTAIGYQSLLSNTEGNSNVALGTTALYYNTEGNFNVALGSGALHENTTGISNVSVGNSALFENTTGEYNVGVGTSNLRDNTTGYQNVAVGANALDANTTGYNNVVIGDYSGTSGNYNNRIALGASVDNTASNQVRIGNSSITSIGGYANWSNVSDKRFKTDIQENVVGLSFILALRPVTYKLDLNAINTAIPMQGRNGKNNINQEKAEMIQTGFIAQEVEKSAKEIGYDFSGVDAPKNENDFYGLRYAEFVVPLVKATQEQQALIEQQQKEIDELKKLVMQLISE